MTKNSLNVNPEDKDNLKAGKLSRRLSSIIEDLAREARFSVTIEDVRNALGERSFATLLIFFATINLLPFPPGSTLVLGIPLLFVSAQMVAGRKAIWLPVGILKRSVSASQIRSVNERVGPRLRWVEQLVQPRYWPFSSRAGDRLIGIYALLLSILITLPIPFGNWLPAFSCALLGLALSERDGVLLGIAFLIGVVSFAIVGFFISAVIIMAMNFI